MIITWQSELHGPVGFRAVAEDYDGTPRLENLWFDVGPKTRHWDRQAVAAYLTYGNVAGGRFQVPHKFSPAVAFAMQKMSGKVPIMPEPIEYYAKALPEGERRLHILPNESLPDDALKPQSQADGYLSIVRSDQAAGAVRWPNGLMVASNAWLHANETSQLGSWYPYIACGALFAQDLEADSLVLHANDVDTASQEWMNLSHLLSTAKLGLEVQS